MRCESAQRELSAAMHESAPAARDVREHAERCPACSRFLGELHRLHQVARIEPAPPVPDLVPAIMARVREERIEAPVPLPRRAFRLPAFPARRTVAAALVAGVVIGFVLVAGGLLPNGGTGTSALASEIPRRLIAAAVDLKGYRAAFAVTERNWSPRVPVRTFRADLWFRAPEEFRVRVRDTTRYPSSAWPLNDLDLVTDGRGWRETGPNPCPPAELPACHPDHIDRAVRHRAPFDAQTPMPTDVIVPMTVLAAQHRVHIVGPDAVAGRAAEVVSLDYEDATPLFGSLQFLGSWRPFYPRDRVLVWLDRSTWFPLRYEVFPAAGSERTLWASQFGIEGDRPGRPSFTATVRSLSTDVPPASTFEGARSGGAFDEGFRTVDRSALPDDMRISATDDLRPTRYGRFERTDARPYDEAVAAFASGLAWATVVRVRDWTQPHLFGVGDFPERVSLAGHGVGYYEPASSTQPRRVAVHTSGAEYLVSTNLPRERLFQLAAGLSPPSRPVPERWFVHRWSGGVVRDGLAPGDAVAGASFRALVPSYLPPGYRAAAAQVVRTPTIHGVTIVYRRPAAELDGIGVRIYQATGESLPPPQSVSEEAVTVRGTVGRWSPENHLLEWVESGVYRSISSPAFDLSTLLRVARSLRGR